MDIALTSPYAMKSATLAIGADDYTAAVSQAEFQPSATVANWRGIGGHRVSSSDLATWVLALAWAQDDDPAGLSQYLLSHEGEEVNVTLTPVAGGTAYTADVILTPGGIGGTAGADLATASANMAVIGKPVAVPAP